MSSDTRTAHSQPSTGSSRATNEQRERATILARFCALFPATRDAEVTVDVYRAETADIPLPWLVEGLRRFRDVPDQEFLPSLPLVRRACAEAIRDARRRARGDSGYAASPQAALDIGVMVRWATAHAPLGPARLGVAATASNA